MNLLDKTALRIAEMGYDYNATESTVVRVSTNNELCKDKIPSIQRQAFAERIHYMWLCLTRNIAITDKHGNVIWEPHESARS